MAIRVAVYPDCPECGSEMECMMRYEGPSSDLHPFGTKQIRWWKCRYCNCESPKCDGGITNFLSFGLDWANKYRKENDKNGNGKRKD